MEKPKFNLPQQLHPKPLISEVADEALRAYPDHTIFGDHRQQEVWAIPHGGGKEIKIYPKKV